MVLATLLLVAAAGCRGEQRVAEPLRIAAASDLQAVLTELEETFAREPGRAVRTQSVLGASGMLAQQIRQGAPFDLFLSADRGFVADLAREGVLIPDSVRPYAVGGLVLAVHPASAGTVKALTDLGRPEIARIALANPETAPYGRAAREALRSAGLWGALEPKVVYAESVRQALQFVTSGNAEAGIVGASLARGSGVSLIPVPDGGHEPIVQALGIVAASRRIKEAREFAAFLLGERGQGILVRHGFQSPPREEGGRAESINPTR